MAPRYFLYLAPGYYDEGALLDAEDSYDRKRLEEHGAEPEFLDFASPGDVQSLHKNDRWIIRLGRNWADQPWGPRPAAAAAADGGSGPRQK